MAAHQTAGRGRLNRVWEAPPDASLLMSILLRPDLAIERMHLVTAAVGLAAADACESVAGFRPGLKWPNDLVVEDRKLAGVLAEAALPAVVVGIGINVNWDTDVPSGGVAANQVAGRPVDLEALLGALLDRLSVRYGDWEGVARDYRRGSATIGREVRVDVADESFTGTAADITDDGHLLVDVGMCLRTVTAGDVVHLRPLG